MLSKHCNDTAKAAHLGARVYNLHSGEASQCHALPHNAVGGRDHSLRCHTGRQDRHHKVEVEEAVPQGIEAKKEVA